VVVDHRMVVGFITICNQFLSPQKFESLSWRGVLDTAICDKNCQSCVAYRWFSSGTPASSTNKTDRHDITEILLKVTLNTINQLIYSSLIER